MSLVYDLKEFEKRINKRITVKISFYLKETDEKEDEYIQGVLEFVDIEADTIEIKQHFTFHNLLHKLETVSVQRTLKNRDFFLISCGDLKASK